MSVDAVGVVTGFVNSGGAERTVELNAAPGTSLGNRRILALQNRAVLRDTGGESAPLDWC